MLHFNRSTGKAVNITCLMTREIVEAHPDEWDTRNDIGDMGHAQQVARRATAHEANYGDPMVEYMAIDKGTGVYPRYDVIEVPREGMPVSKAFNGDYYPEGYIVKVSPTRKKITTSTGETFYRRKQTGSWLANGMWSMVKGHISKWNPHI